MKPLVLVLAAAFACGCAQDALTRHHAEGLGPGTPGASLTRALDGAQALGYTVTRVEGERSRFEAEHGGRSLASLFGSDSNCRLSVRTASIPGAEPASRIFVEGEARDAGSFAGCRKDADAILAIARGDRKPPRRRPPSEVHGNPDAALHGGTFGDY